MHLKCSSFVCSSQTRNTLRHQDGNHRAGAIMGFIDTVENTTNAVNRVDYQKTVGFHKQSRTCFITTFGKNRHKNALTWVVKMLRVGKAHHSVSENPLAEKCWHILRTDQNAQVTEKRKDLMSSEEYHT